MKKALLVILLFSTTQLVHAVTDEFLIQSFVGGDTIPPTVPLNVVAVPVATSQIDVSWDASSDNFALGGYQVFRDTIQVATTTLTSYSDTGLAASTSYSYNIRAFDTSFNFSTTSATATAITLSPPATNTPATSTESGFGGRVVTQAELLITNVVVDSSADQVSINFRTNKLTQAEVSWGRTTDYELGFSTGAVFKKVHNITIDGLAPGSVYEYKIQVFDGKGKVAIETLQFETASGVDIVAPANPMNFQAVVTDNGVQLTWENPIENDFARIRILSSDQFYPIDTRGGYLVFDGVANEAVDFRSPSSQQRFYTIFAYDNAGNASSGAITEVFFAGQTGVSEDVVDVIEFDQIVSDDQDENIKDGLDSVQNDKKQLRLSDISFINEKGNVRHLKDRLVTIGNNEITRISVPYDLLPEHLKTVVIRLTHPEDGSTFSFLLKVNADKSAYEARIGALRAAGIYDFTFEVFDFKTKKIDRLSAFVEVEEIKTFSGSTLSSRWIWFIWLLPLILIVLIVYRRVRR